VRGLFICALASDTHLALNAAHKRDGAINTTTENGDPVSTQHFRAVRMLALTTIFWSLSFPLVKSLGILQAKLIPGVNTWFNAGLTGVMRFGIAAVVMVFIARKTLPRLTRSELYEGLGLGFFAGGGIMLQTDGLGHTSASISAFITQAFCIFVPIFVAIRDRSLPGMRLFIAVLLMIVGIGILSKFNPATFHLGRGEAETLVGAVFFAGQILWLERPVFSGNNPLNFSFVMFATMSVLSAPIAVATWNSPRDVIACYSNPGIIVITLALVFFCTIIAFVEMNKWQPFVPATEAAIIYGAEPVFASIFALFLPAMISRFTGIEYANETITIRLLLGGILIIAANLLLQWRWKKRSRSEITPQ
jgi:drug/metabolite transporter (DMT)-like permease